jgi:uncharacterized membrane protein YphA (DoxX/SURF4 family)
MARGQSDDKVSVPDLASLVLRMPLGVLLISAGVAATQGGRAIVPLNGGAPPGLGWLSESAVAHLAGSLPYAETIVGGLLCLGLLTRAAGGIGALVLLVESLMLGWAGEPFSPRVVYLSVCVAVALVGGGLISTDYIIFGGSRGGGAKR